MAQGPCELHHARFIGPARYYYPTMVIGNEEHRQRLRLCATCAEETRSFCEEALGPGQLELNEETSLECAWCKTAEPGDRPWAVFVTAYWTSDSRSDYFARVHQACAAHMAAALHLDVG
jgi:hypothetical protein